MKARKYSIKQLLKASDDEIAAKLDSLFRRATDYGLRAIWNDQKRRKISRTTTKSDLHITIYVNDWDDYYTITVRETTITFLHDNKFHGKNCKTIFGEPAGEEESDDDGE